MKHVTRFFLITLLFIALGANHHAIAQKRKPANRGSVSVKAQVLTPAQSTPEALRRHEAFLTVWNTLNGNYFDQTFNNLNWEKIKAEYEPRVRSTKTDTEFHLLMEEMINRLGRSHLSIIPPEIYRAIESAKVEARAREAARNQRKAERVAAGGDETKAEDFDFDDPLSQYGIGVDLRILDNRFVITRIEANSAAEYSGLKTGYIIDKVSGVSLSDLVRRIEIQYPKSINVKRYLPFEIVTAFLNGEKDSPVTISYIDETDQARELTIRRERLKSETVSITRNVPERQLAFESRSLSDDVGYIKFNFFAVPVIEKFCNAIGEFKNKKAIIIDLRGNLGGILATLVGLGGMLTDETIDLGTSIYKNDTEKLVAFSKPKNFKGNLAVLVDNQSVSAAEIFAASLQDSDRALIIGDTTAGEALPSITVELPTGAVMLYPIANYKSSSGKFLEGNGVKPDFPVSLNRANLLLGKDDQLGKALALIKEGSAFQMPGRTLKTAEIVASDAPPPPRRLTAAKPVVETGLDIPPPAKESTKIKDAESLRIISEYLTAIGGEKAVGRVESYELHGTAELSVKGTKNEFGISIYRNGPSKYAEILTSQASGEVREVHNGKTHFVQADYGLLRELPVYSDIVETDILSPIRSLQKSDYFSVLTHQGIFDREGRKVHLIDGKTKNGMLVALAFDVETKLLVNFTGGYYGISFGDYKKSGELLLPHSIERERIMTLTLDVIKVSPKIDEAFFSKKQNCFDSVN